MVAGSVQRHENTPQCEAKLKRSRTSEVDLSLLASFHPDGLIVGLVALHLEAGRHLVAHEALLTFQHQHWPAPQQILYIYTKHEDGHECDENVVIVNQCAV